MPTDVDGNEDCEHWAEGVHPPRRHMPHGPMVEPRDRKSATADANVVINSRIGSKIDTRTNWDVVRSAVPRGVGERSSEGSNWTYVKSDEHSR